MAASPTLLIAAWAWSLGCAPALDPAGPSAAGPSPAQPSPPRASAASPREATVHARLVSEHPEVVPGGTLRLGVAFAIAEGWHLYGAARSDSGTPISARIELPDALAAEGGLQWPAPRRHLLPGGLLDHVYEGEVLLVLPVRASDSLKPGDTLAVRAEADWLVCDDDLCLAGSREGMTLELPVVAAASGGAAADAELFRDADRRLPSPAPGASPAGPALPAPRTVADASGTIAAVILERPGARGLVFYPDPGCVELPRLREEGEAAGDALRLTLPEAAARGAVTDARLSGLLETLLPGGQPSRIERIDLALPPLHDRAAPGAGTAQPNPSSEPLQESP